MTLNPLGATPVTLPPDEAELRELGIIRVASEHFEVGPYRYSSLRDAIAQAKRGRVAGNDL